jgi:hypothetical protein
MCRNFLFTILIFGSLFNAQGQNMTLPQITPQSPNVAALDKFIEVPVSLSSGRINLSIPIYEVNVGSVKIPISLDYNNNGLMPDEIPTWVGHGWSLNTGGQIAYHQRGLNDFNSVKGLFAGGQVQLDSFFTGHMNPTLQQLFFEDIIAGNIDAEYDTYDYGFPGGSGSFFFASPTDARLNPKADVQVVKTDSGFKMTDDHGNIFFFEAHEFISSVNEAAVSPDFSDNSCFYLSKIIANNGSIALFKYKSYFFQYTKTYESIFEAQSNPASGCPGSTTNFNDQLTSIYYLLPDSLIFPDGYIKFNHSDSVRADLLAVANNGSSNVPYLKSISIYNYQGQKIKDFSFRQSYFGIHGRLRLDSLTEAKDSLQEKKWQFSYYGQTNTLGIFGNAKDHWGYANTNASNTTIPIADYPSLIPYWQDLGVELADRTSDFNSAKQGLLQSITYPTGGSTQFEYEPNQFKLGSYIDYAFNPFMQIPTTSYTTPIGGGVEYYGGTDTGSFTIPSGYYMVSSYKQKSPDPFYDDADITFTGPYSTQLYTLTNQCGPSDCTTYQQLIFLAGGHYTYAVKGSHYDDSYGIHYLSAILDLKGPASGPVYYPVGGCRITKITHVDSVTNNTLIRRYIYNDTLPDVSFKQIPSYMTSLTQGFQVGFAGCNTCGSSYTINDESVIPLVGNVIEYGIVTELNDSSGVLGKIENHYSFSENIGGATSDPATIPVNTNWYAGNILEQDIYNSSDTLVAKDQNAYTSNYFGTQINGIRVSYSFYSPVINATCRSYNVNLETVFSDTFHKTQEINTLYDGSNQITRTDSLYYNLSKHSRVTGSRSDNSNNTKSIKKIISVFDYDSLNVANSNAANALDTLKQHYINASVEEIDIKEIGGSQYVVGGIMRIYKASKKAVDSIYILKLSSPIIVSGFVFSHVSSTGKFIYDSRYEFKAHVKSYDSRLNIIQGGLANNYETSYIWDYLQTRPIAEIQNADSANVAYTSFEADGGGNWSIGSSSRDTIQAITGSKSYDLNNASITKSGLSSGSTYIVSYWSKNGSYSVSGSTGTKQGRSINGWTYYEHTVTGVSSLTVAKISGTSFIDELRLYPGLAQMTTCTYQPLVGMTSQCDVNNKISYYEYDNFNRLRLIRDQDKNIIKKFTYKYQEQQ